MTGIWWCTRGTSSKYLLRYQIHHTTNLNHMTISHYYIKPKGAHQGASFRAPYHTSKYPIPAILPFIPPKASEVYQMKKVRPVVFYQNFRCFWGIEESILPLYLHFIIRSYNCYPKCITSKSKLVEDYFISLCQNLTLN